MGSWTLLYICGAWLCLPVKEFAEWHCEDYQKHSHARNPHWRSIGHSCNAVLASKNLVQNPQYSMIFFAFRKLISYKKNQYQVMRDIHGPAILNSLDHND
jgi:hypothetical protein